MFIYLDETSGISEQTGQNYKQKSSNKMTVPTG